MLLRFLSLTSHALATTSHGSLSADFNIIIKAWQYVDIALQAISSHKILSDQVIQVGVALTMCACARSMLPQENFGFLDFLRTFLVHPEGKIEV